MGDFYKSPILFAIPIVEEVTNMAAIIMIVEKVIAGFICIGLFSWIGGYVEKIVHLSTLEITSTVARVQAKLTHKDDE